jgi:hypothetical protein
VANNVIRGGGHLQIRYNTFTVQGQPQPFTAGGGNLIIGNFIENANKMAILTYGSGDTYKNVCDVIANNLISNPNSDGSNTWNTGFAISDNAGISHSVGSGDVIRGNGVTDNRSPALMQYAYSLGAALSPATVRQLDFAGNSGSGQTRAFLSQRTGGTDPSIAIRDCSGFNPQGAAVTQPQIPSPGVSVTNPTNQDCTVFITGGTAVSVAIGGVATGVASGAFRVSANQTITLTYDATHPAPTWTWFGE